MSPGIADAKRSVLGDIVSWIGGKGATLTRGGPPAFPLSTLRLSDARQPDRYSAASAFDGSLATSWVEGREDDGIGEMVAFEIPQAVTTVGIVSGYGEQQYFATNNGVKAARLRLCVLKATPWQYGLVLGTDLVAESTLRFEDSLRYQEFPLGLPKSLSSEVYDVNTDTLFAVLEIVEVYPGSRWRDSCIAEIRVR